jgi:hypothetical protein
MPVPLYEVPTELYQPAGVIGGRTPKAALILLAGFLAAAVVVIAPAVLRWPVPSVLDPATQRVPLPLTLVPAALVFGLAVVLQVEDFDGLPMTTWVGLAWRYWQLPKETVLWRAGWGDPPASGTVQDQHVMVDRLDADGTLSVPEGRRTVLRLSKMSSLGLAPEDEQMTYVVRFARWLNALHNRGDRVQLLLAAGPEDTRDHLRAKRTHRYPYLPEGMLAYAEEYEQLLTELGRGLIRRRHYLALPEPADQQRGLQGLARDMARGIRRVGPEATRLDHEGALATLRELWRGPGATTGVQPRRPARGRAQPAEAPTGGGTRAPRRRAVASVAAD